MRIAVDTGGTFTDCVVLEGSQIKILKVFSTPEDPSTGILAGVQARTTELKHNERLDIIHGTTVGTNSLLERRGARVALLTTAGVEDVLEIGRQHRPRLYDLNVRREPSLVPPKLRWGVRERTAMNGKILLRPGGSELRKLLPAIKKARAESVAICFLFSFRNATNEKGVAKLVEQLEIPVSVSHEILPEFREYERLSTVVINAYLAPRLGAYLSRLATRVSFDMPAGFSKNSVSIPNGLSSFEKNKRLRNIFVMQSNGGITTAERASREPVRTILSGPAGGVMASALLAERVGIHRAISFDMGGTSTDVCLLDGPPRTTRETTLAGLPVAVPVLDVHSVGSGGGSIARVDVGGALRVGPESAGAVPGPICYHKGGAQPTVTDAHLILGRLVPEYFLGGAFRLESQEVRRSFERFIRSVPASLRPMLPATPEGLAHGIIAVANATMERALRLISVERGHDPRDFTLVCFGGAGGLHAADLARSLGLAGVIVPLHPGAFSALGILFSDVIKDVSQSILLGVPANAQGGNKSGPQFDSFLNELVKGFEKLECQGLDELRREHFKVSRVKIDRKIAVRYAGQSYELSIPFTRSFPQRFHQEHELAYGHAQPGHALEVVSLQVRLVLPTPKPSLKGPKPIRSQGLRGALLKSKAVWFEGRPRPTPIFDRERIPVGVKFPGPAILVEYSSTTVVPPDFTCYVDEQLNLRLRHHAS